MISVQRMHLAAQAAARDDHEPRREDRVLEGDAATQRVAHHRDPVVAEAISKSRMPTA
jgi:hypothetical protein